MKTIKEQCIEFLVAILVVFAIMMVIIFLNNAKAEHSAPDTTQEQRIHKGGPEI